MKRPAPSDELIGNPRASKHLRTEDYRVSYFTDTAFERQISDLEVSEHDDGWIAANVFMIWPVTKKGKKLQVKVDNYRLDIEFRGGQTELLDFQPGDSLKISLKGAHVEHKKSGSSKSAYLPFMLVLEEGSTVMFTKRPKKEEDNGKIVDIWSRRSPTPVIDWYATPEMGRDLSLSSEARGTIEVEKIEDHTNLRVAIPTPPLTDSSPPRVTNEKSPVNDELDQERSLTPASTSLIQSKSQVNTVDEVTEMKQGRDDEPKCITKEKRKKKKKRDSRHLQPSNTLNPEDHSSLANTRDLNPEKDAGRNQVEEVPKEKLTKKEKLRQKKERQAQQAATLNPPVEPARNPALDLEAGFISDIGPYPALGALEVGPSRSIVGVVLDTSLPRKTRTGDICVSVGIVDPSNYDSGTVFRVNCFTKEYLEWLPAPAKGHILLLRGVKIANWAGGMNGTVYSEKLHWAAYSPSDGRTYHTDLNGVPATQASDGGFGPDLDPFYRPGPKELEYCFKLGEWWRAVEEKRTAGEIVIPSYVRKQREHRLIGEMDINTFFNATVEVVNVAPSLQLGNTDLLVTDYSANRQISNAGALGPRGLWCSTGRLAPRILHDLVAGSYWSLDNIRLKIGPNGDLEGDLYDVKMYKLHLGDDSHAELQALLERKKKYLADTEKDPSQAREGRRASISDARNRGFFDFTIELLYFTDDGNAADLYVTDYTVNDQASTYLPDKLFKKVQGIPVFKIAVFGERNIIQELELGALYRLQNVRVATDQSGSLVGKMSGEDGMIQKVNSKSEHPDVTALLRRKKERNSPNASQSVTTSKGYTHRPENQASSSTGPPACVRSRHSDQKQTTIAKIKANRKCPNKFRLNARIVDFYPLDLVNFTVRRCSKCQKLLPDNRHACTNCDDMMARYVEWIYQFFFRLEDEAGARIDISICDEATIFLLDLKPVNLSEHPDKLQRLTALLRPLLGNLLEVHEGISNNEEIEPVYGPFLDLAIDNWRPSGAEEGKVAYGLTGCEIYCPNDF